MIARKRQKHPRRMRRSSAKAPHRRLEAGGQRPPKLSSPAQQTDREADRVTRPGAPETRDMVTRSAFTGLGAPHVCTALCAFPLKKGRPLRRRYSLPVSPAAFPDYPCAPRGTVGFALAAQLEGMQARERGKEPLDTWTMTCSREKAQTPSQSTARTVPPKLTRGLGWESRVPRTRAMSGGQRLSQTRLESQDCQFSLWRPGLRSALLQTSTYSSGKEG